MPCSKILERMGLEDKPWGKPRSLLNQKRQEIQKIGKGI